MVMLLLAIQIIDCEKVDPHNTLSTHARDADAVGHRKLYCLLCSNLQGNLLLRRVLTRTIFCSRTYKVCQRAIISAGFDASYVTIARVTVNHDVLAGQLDYFWQCARKSLA